jgi:hypothetical protein
MTGQKSFIFGVVKRLLLINARRLGTEQEDESKLSSSEHLNSDENATQANAAIVEDQETKVLQDNNEDQSKVINVEDAAVKSLPRATTTAMAPIDRRKKKNKNKTNKQPRKQKQQQQRKEITIIPKVSKQLHKQDIEIKKLKSILQSQSEAIKQLKSQLKQVTKQTSKIQKQSVSNKKRK